MMIYVFCTAHNTAYTLQANALALRDIYLSANVPYADSVRRRGGHDKKRTQWQTKR